MRGKLRRELETKPEDRPLGSGWLLTLRPKGGKWTFRASFTEGVV